MNHRLAISSYQRRGGRLILTAILATFLLLFVLYGTALAAFRAGGAGNCGEFSTAVEQAIDGDIVTQMTPPRDSGGVVISKSLRLSGSWFPTVNCDENNQTFTETADFFDFGFLYTAPFTRSGLFRDFEPILRVDLSGKKAIVEHFELDGNDPFFASTPRGAGFSGVLTNGAELLLDNNVVKNTYADEVGGGLYLIVDGSRLVIEDSDFTFNTADDNGGGLYVQLVNGAEMVIANSTFSDNDALFGGAFEIQVDESSSLWIENSRFVNNRTTFTNGSGGGGRLLIQGGEVTIVNSLFDGNQAGEQGGGLAVEMQGGHLTIQDSSFANNQATGGIAPAGSALYVDSSGTTEATLALINTTFTNNSGAEAFQTAQSGSGALNTVIYDQQVSLPMIANNLSDPLDYARIISVELDTNYNYIVHFEANFTPDTSSTHLHFFFDTVAPDQAGLPAPPSNWKIYGGPSPFMGYSFRERPFAATGAEQMCVLVANQDHTVRLHTGNCVKLP